jgi:hypothetical protein
VHLTAKESQAPERVTTSKRVTTKSNAHMHQTEREREREREAHTQSNTGEREDDRFRAYWTTGMSVLAVETTVPGETVFFSGIILDEWVHIPANKQAERSD